MSRADYYRMGDWNALCDNCGTKYKGSELRQRWDKAMVCRKCYEIRQPQDYVRAVPDSTAIPWSRPAPPPVFVQVDFGITSRALDVAVLDTITMG